MRSVVLGVLDSAALFDDPGLRYGRANGRGTVHFPIVNGRENRNFAPDLRFGEAGHTERQSSEIRIVREYRAAAGDPEAFVRADAPT